MGLLAAVPIFAAMFSRPAVTGMIAGVTWLAAVTFGLFSPERIGASDSLRLATIALAGILAVFASVLRQRLQVRLSSAEREAATVGEIRRMSETDELTGVRNRWGVLKFVSSQEADSQRTVAIFDIDGLKAVNDAYGHLVGDIFITEVAGRLARALAPTDLVGRWGGDEFVIVLDVPAARSAPILARAQAAVTCEQIQVRGHRIPVAVSFGVAEWSAGQPLDTALAAADTALYVAKLVGRKRTT
jgi:diguanylate cyclase (GGDEF)-like protein